MAAALRLRFHQEGRHAPPLPAGQSPSGPLPTRGAPRPLVLASAALLLLWLPAAVARADLKLDVRTDRTNISLDDTLTLQVTVQSQGTEQARVQMPPFDGFQIVSQQVQRPMQFSFSFGARATVQASSIYTFVLQPLRQGQLVIRPVTAELDGKVQTSHPIQVTVAGGAGAPQQPDPQAPAANGQPPASGARGTAIDNAQVDPIAFLRTVVDKPEPYEGEQVTLTIYLYIRERLQSPPNIETEPTTDGLWVHDLITPGRNIPPGRQLVGEDLYAVYVMRRIAAFPLRSGDVTVGPMALVIDTSSLFDLFAPGRRQPELKRSSQALTLHVKPLPDAGKPAGEIAVGRFTLAAKLDRSQAVTGDAVTLTATVQGQGNVRSIRVAPPPLKGVDVLQPEIKDIVEAPNDLVSGTREFRFLLVPRQPGHVQIPALAFASFDPAQQRYQRVESTALAFDVVGHALPSNNPNATDQKTDAETSPDAQKDDEHHSWAPVRTQSALERGYARLNELAFYPFALGAPALLWLGVLGVGALRRRIAARSDNAAGRAMREAEQRLRNAEAAADDGEAPRFHAEASAALLSVLEARLEESVLGLTRAQLRERLLGRGMAGELADAVLGALERGDLVRFGQSAARPDELRVLAGETRGLFKQLAAFQPRGEQVAA